MRLKVKGILIVLVSVIVFSVTDRSYGAGFSLIEQSVSGLGNAFAGGAASAEDATTIFYNPAGMTRLGSQFVAGFHVVMPYAKFKVDSATRVNGSPLGTEGGGDAGKTGVVPNLYYMNKITDKFFFGLGINSPFGLFTEYSKDWAGRYHAIESGVRTININPSLALRVNDKLSVGFGVNAMYMKAKLTNAVDQALITGGLVTTDGYAEVEGDSWGYGFNFGVIYEFSKDTRAGIAYRSELSQHLQGDLKFDVHPALGANPAFQNREVKANIDLPESLSFSVYHNITERLAIMADITWTNWNTFNEIRIKNMDGSTASVTTTNWKDSYRYSLGLTYSAEKTRYRFGVAYDQTPIPDAEHRTPRIPDESRTWLAAGFGYSFSKNFNLDIGGAYLFVKDPHINKVATPTNENNLRGNLKGTYDANVKILSAQVAWIF